MPKHDRDRKNRRGPIDPTRHDSPLHPPCAFASASVGHI
jgi:hypothetical protein